LSRSLALDVYNIFGVLAALYSILVVSGRHYFEEESIDGATKSE
jgi:hypothetical protein